MKKLKGDCIFSHLKPSTTNGYVQVYVPGRRKVVLHRVLWEATYGPIPDEVEIDHLCRNKGCINLDHMELVSHLENVQRALPYKRPNLTRVAKTHCKYGHEMTEENTSCYGAVRRCKMCNRNRKYGTVEMGIR